MSKYLNPSWLGIAILVLAAAAALWSINRGFPDLKDVERPPEAAAPAPAAADNPLAANLVHDVTARDLEGRVVFRGTVDLTPTLDRIARGERLQFHDDGSTFQNHERHLPHQPAGYYSEYVVPTPNLAGPGPQRVVTGRQGEVYYTFDHYRTFVRVK
jgi:ribonuclease T1